MKKSSSTAASRPKHFASVIAALLAPFARRFVAGISLADALDYTARLKREGFLTTLDHLGESVADEREARIAADQYVVMLRALKERGLDRNVSLKLTQMGLGIDPELSHENLAKIVAAAEETGGFVRVDMEGSDVTTETLDQVRRVRTHRGSPVGTVVQAMLTRTPEDVLQLLESGTTIRLCKGAYKEPKEIAWQSMTDIRREYLSLTKRLLTSGLYHGIATHDPWLIERVQEFVTREKIDRASFEFQMLLGIRPKFQKKIVADGWRLRLYVPFGHDWLAYTWRRMRERKENFWFAIKSIVQR